MQPELGSPPGARASARFRDRIRTDVGTFPPAALCGRLTRLRRFGFRAMPQGCESVLCKTVGPVSSCFDAVSRDEADSHRLHKCAPCPCEMRIREVGLSGVNAAPRHRQPRDAPLPSVHLTLPVFAFFAAADSCDGKRMKRAVWVLMLAALAVGCASTVEKRKKENYGAYSSLTPDFQTAVDQGQVKIGMSPDAVYLAWGKPSQVLTNESAQGTFVTWLYQGSRLKSYRYWTQHTYLYSDYTWDQAYLATSYYPVEYVRAEVVFENNLVKEWRTLPAPVF
jgi:hypothetical protein